VAGWGVDFSPGGTLGDAVGRLVVVEVGEIVANVDGWAVNEGSEDINESLEPDHLKMRLNPNATPPNITRLRIKNTATPTGVMRIVHPTLRRRARKGWDELEGSNWLVIFGRKGYFNRCKKCAQVKPGSLLKPGPVKLVIHTSLGK
jgi:hypothetical protein